MFGSKVIGWVEETFTICLKPESYAALRVERTFQGRHSIREVGVVNQEHYWVTAHIFGNDPGSLRVAVSTARCRGCRP